MEIPEQVPVAVVGAGPTGLTLARMLRKAGVDVLIVAAEGANTSRLRTVDRLPVGRPLDLHPPQPAVPLRRCFAAASRPPRRSQTWSPA